MNDADDDTDDDDADDDGDGGDGAVSQTGSPPGRVKGGTQI